MLIDIGSRGAEAVARAEASGTVYYPENAVIYAQGDRAGPLYMVEFGVVRICRLTADGRRQISAFHFAGEVFGFEAGSEHEFYAESVNGAGVRPLRECEATMADVLKLALDVLVRAQQHQLVLGRRTATEKLAAFLVDLQDRQDDDQAVVLPMQRNDVADYLGLTFETVSRALRALKEDGIIRVPSASVVDVVDGPALRAIAA